MEYSLQLVKIMGALLGVLGLFYLLVKFIKGRNLFNQTNQIKVLERCYLGQNRVVCLLKVIDDIWLVTSTEEEIQFVQQLDKDKVEVDRELNEMPKLLELFNRAGNEAENDED